MRPTASAWALLCQIKCRKTPRQPGWPDSARLLTCPGDDSLSVRPNGRLQRQSTRKLTLIAASWFHPPGCKCPSLHVHVKSVHASILLHSWTVGGMGKTSFHAWLTPELPVVGCNEVHLLKFEYFVSFYFPSTTFQREILYFLLHYIYLTAFITLQIKVFAYIKYKEFIIYGVLW